LAVAMGVGRFAFTPIMPLMLADAGLTLKQAGWLASSNYVGYLIGAILPLLFRTRPETMVRAGLLSIGLATVAMGLTHALFPWLVLRLLAGLSSAWVLIGVSGWSIERLSSYQRPVLTSLVFSGVGVGIAAAGLTCIGMTRNHAGSAAAWIWLGAAALVLTGLIWQCFSTLTTLTPGGADRSSPRTAVPLVCGCDTPRLLLWNLWLRLHHSGDLSAGHDKECIAWVVCICMVLAALRNCSSRCDTSRSSIEAALQQPGTLGSVALDHGSRYSVAGVMARCDDRICRCLAGRCDLHGHHIGGAAGSQAGCGQSCHRTDRRHDMRIRHRANYRPAGRAYRRGERGQLFHRPDPGGGTACLQHRAVETARASGPAKRERNEIEPTCEHAFGSRKPDQKVRPCSAFQGCST
jgi:hypothetical protein